MSKKNRSNLPDDFEELEFDVIEEHWNEYELSDGSRIKTKTVLVKIIVDPNDPKKFSFEFAPIILAVYASSALRGERGNEPMPEEYNTLANYEVRIVKNDEKFSKYTILKSGRIIRLKSTVTQIRRIKDRFSKDGHPFYLVTSSPLITMDADTKKLGA